MTNKEIINEIKPILEELSYPDAVSYLTQNDRGWLEENIRVLEQEPFMNKPCVSHQVCHEDKVKVLDKIRAEIEQVEINGHIRDVECFRAGVNIALNVINKYKAESEDKE